MRISQYLLATLKIAPKNCDTISHKLMLRAGLIRQVSSGLYIWLPTGLRVLRKIKNIIREEMNKCGAIEMSMPIVQPAKLWKESGRWTEYGAELLRFKNRNNQDFILSPTHEEMVSEFIHKESMSHNEEFPLNIYQIHTKYRDEIRPRFGIIRAREFIMKDGYSFHINQKSLQNTYEKMYNAYCTIFNRFALRFCVSQVNPGKIGGILSHEFQAYSAKHTENNISASKIITSNININDVRILQPKNSTSFFLKSFFYTDTMKIVKIPHINSTTKLISTFNLSIQKITKKIIVHTKNKLNNIHSYNFFELGIHNDYQLNYKKKEIILQLTIPASFANLEEIHFFSGNTQLKSLDFINLSIPLIINYNITIMHDCIAKSNISNKYFEINWNQNLLSLKKSELYTTTYQYNTSYANVNKKNKQPAHDVIEIGHIFQLGKKYSNIIYNNNYYDKKKYTKQNLTLNMGCYGIGITRIVAVIIEQHHDKNGIVWPDTIAPFKLAIIPIDMHRSNNVKKVTEKIYNQLLQLIDADDILMDDRKERPGIMFTDIDLIGIPHILIISDRTLLNQEIEYKHRKTNTITKIKLNTLLQFLNKKLL